MKCINEPCDKEAAKPNTFCKECSEGLPPEMQHAICQEALLKAHVNNFPPEQTTTPAIGLSNNTRNLAGHYNFHYKGIKIDPYRIFYEYGITHPAQQHAIKKLMRCGNGKAKSLEQDIDEVIISLMRWKEMIKEDEE